MEEPADEGDRGTSGDNGAGVTRLLGLDEPTAAIQATYRADELLREFEIDRETLRRYEALGLVRPAAGDGEPSYSSADRTRLRVALLGRLLGIPDEEVSRLAEHYTTAKTDQPNRS